MAFGLLFATLSALFNGTFGSFGKTSRVVDAQVPGHVYNLWVCLGFALSSFILAAVIITQGMVLGFTAYGAASGALFAASTGAAVTAINFIGLATASGVWCGTAVLVSFTYGVAVAGDKISDALLAGVALVQLIAGIAGIATAHSCDEDPAVCSDATEPDAERAAQPLLSRHEPEERERGASGGDGAAMGSSMAGLSLAVLAGALGGNVLSPMASAPAPLRGLPYVPSMGLGALLAAPLLTAALEATMRRRGHRKNGLQARAAALPGIAAGAVWNAGNVCSISAVQDPKVGLAVAYPIMQAGLFVAGLWGVLLFGEMRRAGRGARVLYWESGLLVVAGAALLARAK